MQDMQITNLMPHLPDRLLDLICQVLELPICHICGHHRSVLSLPFRMLQLLLCSVLYRMQARVLSLRLPMHIKYLHLPIEWILPHWQSVRTLPDALSALQHNCH